MVVTIEIKQKTIFKKNFDLLAFIKKENLFYGSYNAYHVLRENRIDKHTIVLIAMKLAGVLKLIQKIKM